MTVPVASGRADDLLGLSQRLPPQSREAEQALLGGLLANNSAYDQVAEILRPEHFADPCHGAVFAAIARRIEAGGLADVVSLRPEFDNTGVLDPVGGPGYLAGLLVAMVSPRTCLSYAQVVRGAWARRCIIDACEAAVNEAFAGTDGTEVVQVLDARLSEIAQGQDVSALQTSDRVAEAVVERFKAAIDRKGRLGGVATGYRALDRKLGGLRPGQLIVVGARPSMGKTAFATSVAVRAAAFGARTLFVSAEMGADDVFMRAVAAVSGLPLPALNAGGGILPGTNRFEPFASGGDEEQRAATAAMRLGRLPIRWDDAPLATVSAIRARARRLARAKDGGLDLIVVDYLGRCRGSPEARRAGNRLAEVSEMVRDFKTLAVELRVPVILLSQLSRAGGQRDSWRPVLSDLRDSGEIEQEADVVMFLHREHYYLERAKPEKGAKEKGEDFDQRVNDWYRRLEETRELAEIDVAKQRQGPIGTVRLRWDGPTTWFFDENAETDEAVPGLSLA